MTKVLFNGKEIGSYATNLSITNYQAIDMALGINGYNDEECQEKLKELYKNGNEAVYIDDDGMYCIDYDNYTFEE